VRVLQLGNFIAAPFVGMVFADFGADVFKVERPGRGEEPAVKEGLLTVNVASLVELPSATGQNRSCGTERVQRWRGDRGDPVAGDGVDAGADRAVSSTTRSTIACTRCFT
jgi:hypothetical protein